MGILHRAHSSSQDYALVRNSSTTKILHRGLSYTCHPLELVNCLDSDLDSCLSIMHLRNGQYLHESACGRCTTHLIRSCGEILPNRIMTTLMAPFCVGTASQFSRPGCHFTSFHFHHNRIMLIVPHAFCLFLYIPPHLICMPVTVTQVAASTRMMSFSRSHGRTHCDPCSLDQHHFEKQATMCQNIRLDVELPD